MVGRVLNLLAESAERVTGRSSRGVSPDPGDEPFCASAESGRADFIVTLNPSDFPQDRLRTKVIAPGDPLPGAELGANWSTWRLLRINGRTRRTVTAVLVGEMAIG
jgi:hypothetical protein